MGRVLYGKAAYHALTYGWLMSGLARAVTGIGMRELIRDGARANRSTPTACIWAARPSMRRRKRRRSSSRRARGQERVARLRRAEARRAAGSSGGFGAMYFPEMRSVVQGDIPILDGEIPAANGVATARGLAKMYGATGQRWPRSTACSSCRRSWRPV